MCISFTINYEKTLETIVWFANKKSDAGFHWLLKMIFLADRHHLNKYGIPIIGDDYIAMRFGPVGDTVYSILKGECPVVDEQEKITVANKIVTTKEKPNTNHFSRREIEIFENIFSTYGDYSFADLCDITHSFPEWKDARACRISENPRIDYKYMVDMDTENREGLIEKLEGFSRSIVL